MFQPICPKDPPSLVPMQAGDPLYYTWKIEQIKRFVHQLVYIHHLLNSGTYLLRILRDTLTETMVDCTSTSRTFVNARIVR